MAATSPSKDAMMSQYFHVGAEVEISSDDDGFRGSWFPGTVIQHAKKKNKKNNSCSSRVVVEYKTLTEDVSGTRRLREEVDVLNLRPAQPVEKNRREFKFSDEVDAYYNDGWWEGIVTEVEEGGRFMVFFRGTREQIAFGACDLRLHREWVYGKWVPPVEEEEPGQGRVPVSVPVTPAKENGAMSDEVKPISEIIEQNFIPGELVEISNDEDGFEGAWFSATIVKNLNKGRYLVEYESLRDNDDDTKLLREEVNSQNIRPRPPDVGVVDRFDVLEEVDALYNDGWWAGVISKVLKNDRYSVYFRSTQEELKFEHDDLRVRQKWINGKWVIPPKDEEL